MSGKMLWPENVIWQNTLKSNFEMWSLVKSYDEIEGFEVLITL